MPDKKESFLRPLKALEQGIVDYLDPILSSQGAELIWLRVTGQKGTSCLTLFVDKTSLDELSELSRLLSDALDVGNATKHWFPRSYHLELSSPGLDRPLTKKSHFAKALGQLIRIKSGQGTQKAELDDIQELGIILKGHPECIPWSDIQDANIVYRR